MSLLGEVGLVAHVVVVEPGHDGVAVFRYHSVQAFLCRTHPVALFAHGRCIGAYLFADVEVAVAHRSAIGRLMYPVVVHAHGAEHHLSVVAAQVAIDGKEPFGTQLEEHWVDELHDVEPSEPGQQVQDSHHESNAAQSALRSADVDVAGVVLPEVAVRHHRHLVPQLP